ncbi:type II toxin-antitoxin system RelE family toxin [Pseudolysinimonas yzui]|uniref:type II toxin-antitoxin system RelE family toxin n=1 Tax=Pseudolysinimonas yzui TaxID=2708254 RepID=UPI00174BFEA7|nr:type II toxin-antitoxin system RelE/ParE family toxin [Pseudolysinimonas yzui]
MTSPPCRVELSGPAVRSLERLPPKLVDAVIRYLEGPLADNPLRATKALGAELEGLRAGYVGIAYRVLVRIDEDARLVHVLRIAHRADVYGPR